MPMDAYDVIVARENQLSKKDEEFMEMKRALEVRERENKELKAEVEKLREELDDKKRKNEKFQADYDKFLQTKKDNRAAFCKYYNKAKEMFNERDTNQERIFALMVVNIILSFISIFVESRPLLLLSLLPMTIIGFLDIRYAESLRAIFYYFALFATILAYNGEPVVSHEKLLVFLAAKIFFCLIYTYLLMDDTIDMLDILCTKLEKVSGLNIGFNEQQSTDEDAPTTSAEADENAAPAPESPETDAAAPPEPRDVYLTKKGGAELGLIVSDTDTDSLVVSYVLPHGVSERMNSVDIGDEILTVNGVKVNAAQIEFAQTLVKAIDGSLRMEVRQNKILVPKRHYYL